MWWLLILLVIGFVTFVIIVLLKFRKIDPPIQEKTTCAKDSLPDVAADPERYIKCKDVFGAENSRWWDSVLNRTLVSMEPRLARSPAIVCSDWCPQLELPNTCTNKTKEYNDCVKEISPVDCAEASVPVAKNSTQFLYVSNKGKYACFI